MFQATVGRRAGDNLRDLDTRVELTNNTLRFGLPASVGLKAGDGRLGQVAKLLEESVAAPVEVVLAENYEALVLQMRTGAIEFCWAPPFVCARLETLGFSVALRGVRKGVSSYRSALMCPSSQVTLGDLKGKRAAWVDKDSVAGYLLPLAYLKANDFDVAKDLASQAFAGSYVAAVEHVLQGHVDFTAVFAPPAGVAWKGETGLAEIAPQLAPKMHVVAMTEEVPSSGLVVGRQARADWARGVRLALQRMPHQSETRPLLEGIFQMDAFENAPKMGYRALYRLAATSL